MPLRSNRAYPLAIFLMASLLTGPGAQGKTIYTGASGGRVTFTDHPCEQGSDIASQAADAGRVSPQDCAVERLSTTVANGKGSNPTGA
jgi:hypothetical protein